jgi:hypothetical protein
MLLEFIARRSSDPADAMAMVYPEARALARERPAPRASDKSSARESCA